MTQATPDKKGGGLVFVIKPRQRFTVNDAILQNVGDKKITLRMLSHHRVTRQAWSDTSSGAKEND